MDAVKLLLLNNALGLLLWWRSKVVLHASAVQVDNETWLIAGASGSGKSELVTWLHLQGHRVLSDEMCRLDFDAGEIVVDPAIPVVQLWQRSIENLGLNPQSYRPVRDGLRKYFVPLQPFSHERCRVDNVLVIENTHDRDVEKPCRVHGSDKVKTLMRHCYRPQCLGEMERLTHAFQNCGYIARELPVYRACDNLWSLARFFNVETVRS